MDDLKVSLRQLLKTPGFTVSAIAVLALGIGLNAAMFSIIHALIFASRPFPGPDRLVQLYDRDERTAGDYRPFSYPLYQELLARAEVFEGVLAHDLTIVGVGEGLESRRTFSAVVSASYFDVLGVPLLRGRGFTAEEGQPGADLPVMVTTYAYWKRRGFDPGLLTGAILMAGAWPSLSGDPPVKTEVLSGVEARAFAEAQGIPLAGRQDRSEFKRQYEALIRAKGWHPVKDVHTYVRRQYRQLTLTRRLAEWLMPTVYADTYNHEAGYVYAESWDDGDPATWEGYSEVCAYGATCAGGTSQVHTGNGSVLWASGNPLHSDAFQSWAACAYSGCFGGTWGCWLAGPAYFNCLGIACVGSAVGCGAATILTACEMNPIFC